MPLRLETPVDLRLEIVLRKSFVLLQFFLYLPALYRSLPFRMLIMKLLPSWRLIRWSNILFIYHWRQLYTNFLWPFLVFYMGLLSLYNPFTLLFGQVTGLFRNIWVEVENFLTLCQLHDTISFLLLKILLSLKKLIKLLL